MTPPSAHIVVDRVSSWDHDDITVAAGRRLAVIVAASHLIDHMALSRHCGFSSVGPGFRFPRRGSSGRFRRIAVGDRGKSPTFRCSSQLRFLPYCSARLSGGIEMFSLCHPHATHPSPNKAAPLERRDCVAFSFGRHRRGVGEPQRSAA